MSVYWHAYITHCNMNNSDDKIEILKQDEEFNVSDTKIVIPVIEEEVVVTKKMVETGLVNLSKTIKESVESFEIPLEQEQVVVNRIPKNEIVEVMPAASRYEGDVMIISVLKEVAVIEKRIMLVEEIHVSKIKTEKRETHEVTVRKEEVNITRKDL